MNPREKLLPQPPIDRKAGQQQNPMAATGREGGREGGRKGGRVSVCLDWAGREGGREGGDGVTQSHLRMPTEDVLLLRAQLHLSFHLKSEGALDTPPKRPTHKPFERPATQTLERNEVGRDVNGSEEVGPAVAVLDQVDEEEDEGVENLDVVHL